MTSKTFETAYTDNKVLKVDKLFGNPRLLIKEFNGDTRGFAFAPSDAPALALAILEAAGVAETDSPYMQEAADNLRAYILIEETVAAEARERAELEAEALELLNVVRNARGIMPHLTVAEASPEAMNEWLAVARKAREMRAEK